MRKTPDLAGSSGLLYQAQDSARGQLVPRSQQQAFCNPPCVKQLEKTVLSFDVYGTISLGRRGKELYLQSLAWLWSAQEGVGNLGFWDVSMASSSAPASSAPPTLVGWCFRSRPGTCFSCLSVVWYVFPYSPPPPIHPRQIIPHQPVFPLQGGCKGVGRESTGGHPSWVLHR